MTVRDEACVSRLFKAAVAGTAVGAAAGTVAATWQDVPKVSIGQTTTATAVGNTLGVVTRTAATFGSVAATFAAVECASESVREVKDVYNGILGGFASGCVLGVRHNSLPTAIAAGTVIAAGVTLIDIFDQLNVNKK